MSKSITWGARWIIPIDQPPIRDASLTVVDGRIAAIQAGGRPDADIDLGEVALVPKWVNAHTHLEFSSLNQPLGQPGISITDWIPKVVAWRSRQTAVETRAAIAIGLGESITCDSCGIGEIATVPWFDDMQIDNEVHVRCFIERLGSDPSVARQRIEEAQGWLYGIDPHSSSNFGISPHAPYSLCDELFEGLIQWAIDSQMPVAMHLAETREERLWMETGTGPFLTLLQQLGVPDAPSLNRRPLYYLQALAETSHALVIHGNYLEIDELDFLQGKPNIYLVYCPRTHHFFDHRPYALCEILSRGISIAVGTDSRASNPDLNVLNELRWIRKSFPDISPHTILEMGTLNGARALQFEKELGSLSLGKRGDFLVMPVGNGCDPLESILDIPS